MEGVEFLSVLRKEVIWKYFLLIVQILYTLDKFEGKGFTFWQMKQIQMIQFLSFSISFLGMNS
jgi:hypothetical protein